MFGFLKQPDKLFSQEINLKNLLCNPVTGFEQTTSQSCVSSDNERQDSLILQVLTGTINSLMSLHSFVGNKHYFSQLYLVIRNTK